MPLRDILTREEIDLMERMVQTERDKVIMRIFGDCGLRREELTQLRPEDVVRSGRQAYLRVLGKLDRVRDVPLPSPLLRRLERVIEGRPGDRSADRIFISFRRGPAGEYEALTSNGVYQVIRDAVSRAGIKKRVHPHLRHSWMTEMLRHGMSPIQLSLIAGASVQVISEHYTHLTKGDAYHAMLQGPQRRTDRSRRLRPAPIAMGDLLLRTALPAKAKSNASRAEVHTTNVIEGRNVRARCRLMRSFLPRPCQPTMSAWAPLRRWSGSSTSLGHGSSRTSSSNSALTRILEQRIEPYFRFPGGSSKRSVRPPHHGTVTRGMSAARSTGL